MDIKETSDNLNALKKKYEEAVKGAVEPLEAQLVAAVAAFPEVLAVKWEQYTPYFNDGNSCTFRVGDVAVITQAYLDGSFNEYGEYDREGDFYEVAINGYCEGLAFDRYIKDEDGKYVKTPTGQLKRKKNYEELSREAHGPMEELCNFITENDDLMERCFGDHVRVVVTAKGVTTQYFEHD